MQKTRSWHVLLALNVVLLIVLADTTTRSQPQPPVADVLRARLIELVNEQGQMRAQLHIAEDGGGELRLRNGRGEIRVKFGATTDGAVLLMLDQATEPGVRLATDRSGPNLKLTAPGKPERIIGPDRDR